MMCVRGELPWLYELCGCTARVCQVNEPDEPWEFDILLQEVAQAMQADIDKKEADDKDPAPF
jgi:hypothetical protein